MFSAFSSVMGNLFILSALLLVLYATPISGGMQSGEAYMTFSGDDEYKCKVFAFDAKYGFSNDVHVQLRLKLNAYQAAVSWIESITAQGFTGCVRISGPITFDRIFLTWIAFKSSDVTGVGLTKVENVPFWTAGTKCLTVYTGDTFADGAPIVFLTVIHTNPPKNIRDATSVWAEEVTTLNFKVCLRELKNFDGVHENMKVNILALSSSPSAWAVPNLDATLLQNNNIPNASSGYSFCKDVTFPQKYYTVPKVITTAAHDKNTIDPDNNAITEWVTVVDQTMFKVCLKDIQCYQANHDPIAVNYMVIGQIDPCEYASCSADKYCSVNEASMSYSCVCNSCGDQNAQVCDTDGVTHESECHLNRKICLGKTNATKDHDGACVPFILERGRVALHLSTVDVLCKTVYFEPNSYNSNESRINVQTSINYFNSTGSFVHDAAVTWVENVTFTSFKVCALKADRAERLTPDSGVTFVDYIAFQESPAGAVSSQLSMPLNWWDGTTCKTVTFEKNMFSSAPYVFLTAEHSVLAQKHDAATVWVENVSPNDFKACLREMQNFDGLHENITVNWLAYETLQNAAKLNSNQQIVNFANDELPKPAYHNAFCRDTSLGKAYSKTPTIIVSAAHSSGGVSDNVIPEYNSIASWVEGINNTYYRLCVKEIHNPNGYDPVKVTTLIIGS